jgi:predicted kinase
LQAARRYLASSAPALIAIGGLSGTGKSTLGATLAARIGPAPGAVHLRSDLERKALFGVGETVRLPSAAYSRASADVVYATVCKKARLVLGAGHAVIADAVYQTPAQRSAIEFAAGNAGVPFRGIWLTAEPETLSARVAGRRNDASDASAEIIARQLALDKGPLSPAWTHLDASGCPAETLSLALSALGIDGPQAATGGGKGP